MYRYMCGMLIFFDHVLDVPGNCLSSSLQTRLSMKSTVIILVAFLFQISVYGQKKTGTPNSGYNKASYSTAQAGTFMKTWYVAGPIPVGTNSSKPDGAQQEKAFKEDLLDPVTIVTGKLLTPVQVNQKPVQWKLISSANDAVLLDTVFGKTGNDFVYAYALAEVKADQPGTMMLGVGSDDGVKVWLNGKLVHENWVPGQSIKIKTSCRFIWLKAVTRCC